MSLCQDYFANSCCLCLFSMCFFVIQSVIVNTDTDFQNLQHKDTDVAFP